MQSGFGSVLLSLSLSLALSLLLASIECDRMRVVRAFKVSVIIIHAIVLFLMFKCLNFISLRSKLVAVEIQIKARIRELLDNIDNLLAVNDSNLSKVFVFEQKPFIEEFRFIV